jgi:hypothetical protein
VLQYSFSWKQLSVIAGVSFWRFYFRLYGGTIRTPQVIEFLKALQATIGKKLLIIWDRPESTWQGQQVERFRGDGKSVELLPTGA